jgi:hypothetical protein
LRPPAVLPVATFGPSAEPTSAQLIAGAPMLPASGPSRSMSSASRVRRDVGQRSFHAEAGILASRCSSLLFSRPIIIL